MKQSKITNYCYVENLERIYKAYSKKIQANYEIALATPEIFGAQLNNEYRKLRNSKSDKWKRLGKLPVRIYGSGDYIPGHLKFLNILNFIFYLISKSLTSPLMENQLNELLKLPNLTSVVLSFDEKNLKHYAHATKFFGKDRIAFAFTGKPKEFEVLKEKFNIFFNTSDKKLDKIYTRKFKEQCPCDSGVLASKEACSHCSKCWRSSLTAETAWNT